MSAKINLGNLLFNPGDEKAFVYKGPSMNPTLKAPDIQPTVFGFGFMLKLQTMDEMLDKLRTFFEKKPEISMAFLFGSQIKGCARPASDFDVAVWFKKTPSLSQVDKLWNEITKVVQKEVDLIILNQARPTVAWAALRGKKLKMGNWGLYFKLLLNVSTEAEDIQDFNIDLWKLRMKVRGEA